ncbi:hypothetical protein [Pseudovibrio sp. SCP19]|uniref:hypothetical protein n=1 Tax=Pseudovibrio sp. SCP19 TaxID=3141374 RepID=UPI00333D4D38
MRILLLLSLLTVALTGCQSQSACNKSDECFTKRISSSKKTMETYAYKDIFSDTTTKSWSKKQGTQYEYFSKSGRSYLVYPGSTHVLKGRWEVVHTGSDAEICTQYPVNQRSSVAGMPSGHWECKNTFTYTKHLDEIRDGDPLRLARTSKLPKVLPPNINLPIQAAMYEVGYKAKLARNKVCRWNRNACRP